MSELINPCNICFEKEGSPKLFLPMYEGKVVDPEGCDDYAYMPVCQECLDEFEQQARLESQQARRPATKIEIEAMGAIVNLQDKNKELTDRLNQIAKEVETMRQYAIKHSLMIGECVAWNNLKKLTIYRGR